MGIHYDSKLQMLDFVLILFYLLHFFPLQSFISVCLQLKCNVLRDLVPFAQFKKREKHPWRSVTF